MLSHRSMASEADNVASYWAARPDDVFLGVLPLFHVNAQLVTLLPALATGARLVVARSFSAGGWIDLVRRHGVTISSIVGTQVRMLMATPERPDDSETPPCASCPTASTSHRPCGRPSSAASARRCATSTA